MVFTPAIVALVVFGGLALQLMCMTLTTLMLGEFVALALRPATLALKGVILMSGLLLAAATSGLLQPSTHDLLPCVCLFFLLATVLANPRDLAQGMSHAALGSLGMVWCAQTLPYLSQLRALPDGGLPLALMTLLATWAGDTGAYFVGKYAGMRKLYPKVSPSKTWEGAAGGAACAAVAAAAVNETMHGPLTPACAVCLGLIAAAFGLFGDLCESLLKRSVGKKDSSGLIPGHGGVLDRFDGVLFAAPAVYFALAWLPLR